MPAVARSRGAAILASAMLLAVACGSTTPNPTGSAPTAAPTPSGAPPTGANPTGAPPSPTVPATDAPSAPPSGGPNLPVGAVWSAVALEGDEFDWSPAGRVFNDITHGSADRLIAVGKDAAKPLIALSDDGGLTWRTVATNEPDATETESLSAVSYGPGGSLMAVGTHAAGCEAVLDLRLACGRFRPIAWRSDDNGETWLHLDASALADAGPEVHLVDIAGDSDGFVLAANVMGPSPAGARAWSTTDGTDWTEVARFQPTGGWLARATTVIALGDETYVAGEEVVCGDWFDNGFWVISGTFVTRVRLWQITDAGPAQVDLASAGLAEPPVPSGCGDSFVAESGTYGNGWRGVGPIYGRPAFVDQAAVHVLGAGGAWTAEPFAAPPESDQIAIAGHGDWLVAQSSRLGPVSLTGYAHQDAGGFESGGLGNTIHESADTYLSAVVGTAEFVVAVGSSAKGKRPAVWRSVAAPAAPAPPTCEPAPGADCKGVDLSFADLSGRDLAGIDLRGANLSFANLAAADLSGALLEGAQVTHIDLTGANLTGAVLVGLNLQGVIDPALTAGVDLTNADLSGARLDVVDGMNFDGVKARQAALRATQPTSVSAVGADLREAYLATTFGADIVAITFDFTGTDLRKMGVRGVDLAGTTFAGANVGNGLASGMWFAEDTPCPNGGKGNLIGFQMYYCPGLTD